MSEHITHVAMDDSKRKIIAGVLRPEATEPELRSLPNGPRHLRRFFERLQREGRVVACYEAGPSGYDLYRQLVTLNIPCQEVPILGEVTCNAALMPALRGALQELVDRGLDGLISIYSGCFAVRTVARSDAAPPSQHAYGAAIDIDAPTNGYGDTTPAMDPRVVGVLERHGFLWGGHFLIPDGMHFEYGSSSARDQ